MTRATTARTAVAWVFGLNGFCFATLVSRLPDLRARLDLSDGALGVVLLAVALGAMVAMPVAGHLIDRWGAGAVVRGGAVLDLTGLVLAGVCGSAGWAPGLAIGFFCYGFGAGTWDVAINVDGAAVERELGRSIMPRFHACWSVGSFVGAGVGAAAAGLGVPVVWHYAGVPGVAVVAAWVASRRMLPVDDHAAERRSDAPGSAWLEPRTVAIGLMVLAFALAEGGANDWLALGLVDGYGAPHWAGVLGFALFVASMTLGRVVGPVALDRLGRVRSMLGSAAMSAAGVLIVVWAGVAALAVVGIVLWGLGAALGFPVGMTAAGDDPARAARRVSVVSTIGYGAFLGGPPFLGLVGNHVGTLGSLLVIAVAMVPAVALVPALRSARPRS